jgi:alpha-L-rhamnosidase
MNRRDFLKRTALTGGTGLLAAPALLAPASAAGGTQGRFGSGSSVVPRRLPDLSPARWIWFPSGRTLPNTFVLFRKELRLLAPVRRATGWIAADSRYQLEVNGKRVQWGPAPSDPRWPEADPVDLTVYLREDQNVLGATVLFYGHGDGTWPVGRPGFLFWLELEHSDGSFELLVSDSSWRAMVARAWAPGQYKRWYLRALQEEFDARKYPFGWSEPGFFLSDDWLPAMPLDGSPNRPALSAGYPDHLRDTGPGPADTALRPRSIPLMHEVLVPVLRLAGSHWLRWRRTPQEYFECRTPEAFAADRQPSAVALEPGVWRVEMDGRRGAVLTFELAEQMVGWPFFTIEAPAGTQVELLVHEAHELGGPPLLNTHFDSWTRFICREGKNRFETFDFESLRWLQLHIHGSTGPVFIRQVGVRRRRYPWPNEPHIQTTEPALQRLFDASLNTLNNCAQETVVDGMARERQQYSGDCGHVLHALHLGLGEKRLPARYLTTFSQGMTLDGYFLDCWPAYDRLARLSQRQLDLTPWGPILDHGVGFHFDCWFHFLYSGDAEALREPYPRLLRFADYLLGRVGRDGLLPVEDLGVPTVWIDHQAYREQRHKQCAFNLYTAAMLRAALVPIATVMNDTRAAEAAQDLGGRLHQAAVRHFWSRQHRLFVNNLPWLSKERAIRTCDRSLATAILFDQCPEGDTAASVRALVDCPPSMGFSYPANAGWRLWALAKAGRGDILLKDLRERWATMESVRLNNTLQEDWTVRPDSSQQWSHCAVVPLYLTFQGVAGIWPLEPGFRRLELRPQPADLEMLELVVHTVPGPIRFRSQGLRGARQLTLDLPPRCEGELILHQSEQVPLVEAPRPAPPGHRRFFVPGGTPIELTLRRT